MAAASAGGAATASVPTLPDPVPQNASALPDVTTAPDGGGGTDSSTVDGTTTDSGGPACDPTAYAGDSGCTPCGTVPLTACPLSALGVRPVANTPGEFSARIKLEIEKWGKVVRDAKLRIE